MDIKDFYIDEPVMVSFAAPEIGWFIQRYQGFLRYLKLEKYKDHKCLLMINPQLHCLVHDYTSFSIDLPQWYYDLHLETDCYESPLPGSPPGSLTPSDVYARLIEYFRKFYNREKAVEIWTPRGYNTIIDSKPQTFIQYSSDVIPEFDKPYVVVYPRGRDRAPQRNVPEHIWVDVVEQLRKHFMVVIVGTPGGSCLADYKAEGVVNTIKQFEADKMEKTIDFLTYADMSIGSQSGPTHISLLCKTPSYIIGHERVRHAIIENRFKAPTSFREVADYRCVSPEEIVGDVLAFHERLTTAGITPRLKSFEQVAQEDMMNLVGIVKQRREEI